MKISLLVVVKVSYSIQPFGNPLISWLTDSNVYIWQRESGQLIERLHGHTSLGPDMECVNCVAWDTSSSCTFASGGDDEKIRM